MKTFENFCEMSKYLNDSVFPHIHKKYSELKTEKEKFFKLFDEICKNLVSDDIEIGNEIDNRPSRKINYYLTKSGFMKNNFWANNNRKQRMLNDDILKIWRGDCTFISKLTENKQSLILPFIYAMKTLPTNVTILTDIEVYDNEFKKIMIKKIVFEATSRWDNNYSETKLLLYYEDENNINIGDNHSLKNCLLLYQIYDIYKEKVDKEIEDYVQKWKDMNIKLNEIFASHFVVKKLTR